MMPSKTFLNLILVPTIVSQILWIGESQAVPKYEKICPEYLWMITSISPDIEKPDRHRADCSSDERIAFIEEVIKKGIGTVKNKDLILAIAVRKGHLKVVEYLLDNSANIERKWGERQYTPLMFAVLKGHIDMVKLLLDHGANIYVKGNDGRNSIILSKERRHDEITRLLEDAKDEERVSLWQYFLQILQQATK